jgi:hypothetical protein
VNQQGTGSGNDHAGDHLGESSPVERIDVARIGGSRREGDVVYYHPGQRGPYADGQAALADVPPGGTFVLGHAEYDVATEGRIVRERPISVLGTGWHRPPDAYGADARYEGAVVVNTGEDTLDAPAIDVDAPDPGNEANADVSPAKQNVVRDIAVMHEGHSTPAIRFRNAIFTTLADCGVECRSSGAKGVVFDGRGFFSRMHRCQVSSATDLCVQVTGGGYAHEFYSNHIRTNVDGARAAFQTECDRTIVVGGECAARGSDTAVAIRFHNSGNSLTLYGGLVIQPGIEHTTVGIEIGGENRGYHQVYMHDVGLPLNDMDVGVRFGNTRGSKLVNPKPMSIAKDGRGDIVEWTAEAENCGVVTDAAAMTPGTFVDQGTRAGPITGETHTNHGSRNPYVRIAGSASREQLAAVPTGVPTTVDYVTSEGAPAYHDGTDWYSLREAGKRFSP